MTLYQDAPFAIQVEFTEGCSLYCDFCGLQGIRPSKGDYKFMTEETAASIAQQIADLKWNPRVEFAMHGEPSMNPRFLDLLAIFRDKLPKHHMMMTSNGSGFIPMGTINDAMDYLTILAFDDYKNSDFVERALKNNKIDYTVYNYPQQKEGNPHQRTKQKFVTVIQDIVEADKGTHAKLNNQCGTAFPLDFSKEGKRCAKPFREMAIRWDGSIALCCQDWRGTYRCGHTSEGLDVVWQGKAFTLARRMLLEGRRAVPPCLGCNLTSYRTGLLPDKMGKVKLEPWTKEDRDWMLAHGAAKPLSPVVFRPWEKKND